MEPRSGFAKLWRVGLLLAAVAIVSIASRLPAARAQTQPTAQRATRLAPSDTARVIDRVQALFPSTRGWFRIVQGARFTVAQDGRWVPVYSSLTHVRVRRADNAGHTLVPSFARFFDAPTRIASGEDATVYFEIAPLAGRHVAVHQEDGLVVYADAYRDTDAMYKATPTHTDEYLFLRTALAPTEWRYRIVRGPGLHALRQVGNTLEALDANGNARFRGGRPYVVDARGTRREGTLRLEGDDVVVSVATGGLQYPLLVDPDWRVTGDMAYGRFYFRANVLPSGRIFVTGGCSSSVCSGDLTIPACRTVVRAAEALDIHGMRNWTAAGDDAEGRFFHAGVSLATGSVLVAGGCTNPDCTSVTASARLYNPSDSMFMPLPDLAEARAGFAGVMLRDGRVLLAGGCNHTRCTTRTEIYNPMTRMFVAGGAMREARGRAEVVMLADGRVLVTGGCTDITCTQVLQSAEVFDPARNEWTLTAPMTSRRAGHHATLLLDGRVFVGGGCPNQTCTTFLRSTEFYDPAMNRFVAGPDQRQARLAARAVRLPDGSVLINQGCAGRADCDLTNERFSPATNTFAMVEPAVTTRGFHELVLHAGTRQVVALAGCQPGTCSWWNETYDISGIMPAPDAGTDASTDTGPLPDVPENDVVNADVPGPSDGGAESGADTGTPNDTGIDPRPRPACGCRTVASDPRWSAWGVISLAFVAAALRRVRSGRHAPRKERRTIPFVFGAVCSAALFVACSPPPITDAAPDGTDAIVTDLADIPVDTVPSDDGRLDVASDTGDAANDVTSDGADTPDVPTVCTPACGMCQQCRSGMCATVGMPRTAMAIGIGWNHSLAIAADGTAMTWGANGMGELGQGDREARSYAAPVMTGTPGFRTVVAGSRHSCGIRTDGSLWCWGVNVHGQLGNGDTTERLVPTRVGTEADWIEIQCGGLHTCGLRAGGALWCWGANAAGQLGLGMTTGDQLTPQRAGTMTGWRGLAAKARFNCALRPDNSLWCWGDNSDGQLGTGDTMDRNAPTQVMTGQTWAWVRPGPLHTCAITTSGELYCWGANESGQLGNGMTVGSRTAVRVGTDSDWTLVSGGFSHTCGIRRGGGLFCWGANSAGQLGLGTTAMQTTPATVSAGTAFTEVLLGMSHTCALTMAGAVQCWGDNPFGQIGDATTTQRRSPTPVCFSR